MPKLNTNFEKGMLIIMVIDHGFGIPEADQAHMFERFFPDSQGHKYSEN